MIDEFGNTLFTMDTPNFGFSESHDFCLPYVAVSGCTNSFADNYNSLANEDDGSCIFSCNYIVFDLLSDCWGSETTFEIIEDATGNILISDGPFVNNTNFTYELCVPDGCYTLNVYDSYGDGLSSCNGGDYSIIDLNGNILAQIGDLNFGDFATHNFCVSLSSPGCTNTNACNYNSTATTDDGSCTFPGCQDSTACNYDASAGCADTCDYLDVCSICGGTATILGCTDTSACNFNSLADCDDASCEYIDACDVCGGNGTIAGCTDNTACNYNVTADCDDGSCMYADACGVCGGSGTEAGCMDPSACNFNITADCDDGSCDYLSCTCPMDLNPDGYIDVADLLMFLTDFGCAPQSVCFGDFTGDGYTNTADMLAFLTAFGGDCP